jgi:hypothetical protein
LDFVYLLGQVSRQMNIAFFKGTSFLFIYISMFISVELITRSTIWLWVLCYLVIHNVFVCVYVHISIYVYVNIYV